MVWRPGIALAFAGIVVASCAHNEEPVQPPTPPPQAQAAPPTVCPDTQPGNGCVTLQFKVAPSIEKRSVHPIRGSLHWGLYRSSDVGMFGPGKHQPLLSGTLDVDLTSPSTTANVTVPDLAPHHYKALAYVDVTNSGRGTAITGDPVTVPHGAIAVEPNEKADATVTFDFIR